MTLAPPAMFEATRQVDVRLQLLTSAPRALKNRARVHFHSHTMESVAEVGLYEGKEPDSTSAKSAKLGRPQIQPGQEAFARLKLPEAALLLPGDRFIIRQFSPVVTIGGGVVLDAAPMRRMPGLADFLKVLGGGNGETILRVRIARRLQEGIAISRLVAETGWTQSFVEAQLGQAVKEGRVVRIGELFLDSPALEALRLSIVSSVEDFHKKNPLVGGIAKEQLREQSGASVEVFDAVLSMLVRGKKLEVAGELVRLPGHGVVMKDEEAESMQMIEQAFGSAGLKVPALHEVIAGLKVDKARAQKIVTLLLRDKVLIKVSNELVFHRSALEQLRRELTAYKAKLPRIDVASFKELTGVSRKYAIPLLEYLDRERVTRRIGDAREIL
jgi:selenocysteine-specific elongation factor